MILIAGVVGVAIGGGCGRIANTNGPPGAVGPDACPGQFTATVRQAGIDKVDLLFMIDNSQSMGDKQELLRQAVADLTTNLINPPCRDRTDPTQIDGTSQSGDCSAIPNSVPAFAPVHDLHIGIVTSSLGGRGSDACPASPNPVTMTGDSHQDDRGELINRADPQHNQSETPVGDAQPSNFLAWFPSVPANLGKPGPADTAITDPAQLATDFQDLVSGVHQFGCGWEAQLEAWYRFLVQPDPYGSVSAPTNNVVSLQGVDATILRQRHDFLRPDSLLGIVVVTDEDATEVTDPLALGGQGWAYMDGTRFPGGPGTTAAMGTSACGPTPTIGPNPGPTTPRCKSCGFSTDPDVIADKVAGGNCAKNGGYFDPNAVPPQDSLNVRGVYQKQRFGVDPGFPITRYTNGLTSASVPDRQGEHPSPGSYVGNNDCSNPIFSTNLPTDPNADLCHLPRGPRTPDDVFFAAITGVPHQLLQAKPGDSDCPSGTAPEDCPQKKILTDGAPGSDWWTIVGKDPEGYDFTGVDPHMLVSIAPRAGLPPPAAGNGTDPIHGREWDTGGKDQQYACTFQLPLPRDCAKPPGSAGACDCIPGETPPLCDPTTPTLQVRGKAYPSIKELTLVRMLKEQGVASSLCPIHDVLDPNNPNDPLYGYRPAVAAIVDRFTNALSGQCLPQSLQPAMGNCGNVSCIILETLSNEMGSADIQAVAAACGQFPGLTAPSPEVLASFNQKEDAQWSAAGGAQGGLGPRPSTLLTCQMTQLVPQGAFDASCSTPSAIAAGKYSYIADAGNGSCATAAEPGWCYVAGPGAAPCPQLIAFTPAGNPQVGSRVTMMCEQAGCGP